MQLYTGKLIITTLSSIILEVMGGATMGQASKILGKIYMWKFLRNKKIKISYLGYIA